MRSTEIRSLAIGTAAGALMFTLIAPLNGCGNSTPPPPPPPPVVEAPPPPPEKPAVTSIAQLMKDLGISNKVRLAEERAPATEHERVAVLKFFDGFAKSDSASIKGAMGETDRLILELMDRDGNFARATSPIETIKLATGNVGGKPYVIAEFVSGPLYQYQLWQFSVDGDGRKITSQVFDSYVQPENVVARFSTPDPVARIAEWIKLVAADRLKADEPDEIIKPPQRVAKAEEDEESKSSSGNGPIAAPPMRRKPPSEPIKPPDFKPGGN